MPTARTKAAAKKTTPPPEQIPASAPVRIDVRVAGRIRFSGDVYEPAFDVTDNRVAFTADRHPTMIDTPGATIAPPTRFVDQTDPRDQEKIIQRVHSGRRDITEEQP
jgi:hypothetical protein